MKHNRLSRIFIEQAININAIELSQDQSHYLATVMRQEVGNELLIFNGRDGEYLSKIIESNKKKVIIQPIHQTRSQINDSNLILIFSLIKSHRLHFLIEKACELGIKAFIPVITKHCVSDKLNLEKAKSWIIEAAEQSMRLTIPTISEPTTLASLLHNWDSKTRIIFANETEKATSLQKVINSVNKEDEYAILVGPEGGFSDDEIESLNILSFVSSVHLGPRIMRAETAAISTIACVQMLCDNLSKRDL